MDGRIGAFGRRGGRGSPAAALLALAMATAPVGASALGGQERRDPPQAGGDAPPEVMGEVLSRTPAGHLIYDAGKVLAQVREAVGYERLEAAGGVALAGVVEEDGVESAFELRARPDGAYLLRQGGLTGGTSWYDGESGLAVDWNGWRRALGPWDVHRDQLFAWLRTGLWLDPEGPFEIVGVKPRAGDAPAPDQVMLTLRHGDGPLAAAVLVGRDDWLPERANHPAGLGSDAEIRFDSWTRHGGLLLPARVERRAGTTSVWRLETAELGAAAASPGPAPEPGGRGVGVSWDREAPAALEVRLARGGLLLVRPELAGRELGWFLLDTGSPTMVVNPRVSRELGLEPLARLPLRWILGSTTGAVVRLPDLRLGPLRLSGLLATEMDTAALTPYLEAEVVGILGYDLFAAAVVELSTADPSVALHDPAAYGGHDLPWGPLPLHGKHPLGRGRLPTGRGLYRLDLGAGQVASGVLLDAAASATVARHPAWRPLRRERAGEIEVIVGRLPWFELEGVTFRGPLVALLADPAETFLRDDYTAGVVGVGILGAFDLVLDYSRNRIAFVPRLGPDGKGAPPDPSPPPGGGG